MDGDLHKYNDNNGDVFDAQDPIPQAFSHFSWEMSEGKILICDLQGWGHLLTDPQIHTIDGEGFGQGNMGPEGIDNFFANHKCNAVCAKLGLVKGGKSHPIPQVRANRAQSKHSIMQACGWRRWACFH